MNAPPGAGNPVRGDSDFRMPSPRVELARIAAELVAARLRRGELDEKWGHAMYTAGCRRSPKTIEVAMAELDAQIVALEDRHEELEELASTPAPVPSAASVAAAPELPEYLDTKEAAALLGVGVKGLESMRARGKGPPFVRVGPRVRYRRSDLR